MKTIARLITITMGLSLLLITSSAMSSTISKTELITLAQKHLSFDLQNAATVCFNIKESRMNDALNNGLSSCGDDLPNTINSDKIEFELSIMTDCVQEHINAKFGLNSDMLYECEDKLTARDMAADPPTEHLLSYYSEIINTGLKIHAAQSSVDEVTLPLYPNSHVVSHLSNNQMAIGDTAILPAIVLGTDADFSQVRAFYQQKLPSYKSFAIANGIIFMKQAPDNFGILSHFPLYTNTPHVLIEDMQHNIHNNRKGKTKIEISYLKL